MARNYAALFHEYLDEMQELSDAEFGRLCRALIQYSADGTPIKLSGNERFYAKRVMAHEDSAQESYNDYHKMHSDAGKKGAAKRWHKETNDNKSWQAIADDDKNSNSNSNSNSSSILSTNVDNKRAHEKHPTLEEVTAYCLERGNGIEPQRWYDYYSSNGWKVGKNQMKDWKAAVRTWERNGVDKPKQPKSFADMWREMPDDET